MFKRLYRLLFILLCLSGCTLKAVETGESFGIWVDGSENGSKPALQMATLKIPGLWDQPQDFLNSGTNWSSQDNKKLPEEIELTWQAKGEVQTHTQRIKVRSQIPASVVDKLKIESDSPYVISLKFVVINDQLQLKWQLYKLPEAFDGKSTVIAQSSNWN